MRLYIALFCDYRGKKVGAKGIRNYLIDGVSGTGKTSVATELERRGHHVLHGDRMLAYRGDPLSGERLIVPDDAPLDAAFRHRHHIWDVAKVRALTADRSHPLSFFCGGARNFPAFLPLFDGVFVLDVDRETLIHRLASRADDEFGGKPEERDLILRLHTTREDVPQNATVIDATAPIEAVVDALLEHIG
ncbi:nucleoside/nucleotide kinase family protein [Xaviernesmea oryzae]|uniref:nucleoside kinase n=1 Tax=Xaviernesmea oryzae TaxID=464029 RepID=UPI001F28D168|nr:nucleoside kinase [Xaviernesmea oryzae]